MKDQWRKKIVKYSKFDGGGGGEPENHGWPTSCSSAFKQNSGEREGRQPRGKRVLRLES